MTIMINLNHGTGRNRSDYGNKGQGNPAIDGEKRTMWIFEPHAAEEAFETDDLQVQK